MTDMMVCLLFFCFIAVERWVIISSAPFRAWASTPRFLRSSANLLLENTSCADISSFLNGSAIYTVAAVLKESRYLDWNTCLLEDAVLGSNKKNSQSI